MKPISAASYDIVFNADGYVHLNQFLSAANYSKIFIIVDEHTHENCLKALLSEVESETPLDIIEIPAGEAHKTIDTCVQVWEALAEIGADRKGLILNLGGGVVTDLGGFIASTFKRGMDFINVPTSLLSMVDASVGGKTGVDLGTLKNLVGVINNPKMVLIDVSFLDTLPQNEMRSGLAEIYKHGLIADPNYWNKLTDLSTLTSNDLNQIIYESVVIKNTIVLEDPTEQNARKTLNFGHTLGHAIESYCLGHETRSTLLHGEAIAIGMILECYLSNKHVGLPDASLKEITTTLLEMYEHVHFDTSEIEPIIELLKHDKKNDHGNINFVLLEAIGKPIIDQQVDNDLINDSFRYYAENQ
ncbi:MAG: 3-dehydroquinate synthase [Flavobacteriales bacterium]|jgi:3-dehydroquinate synthase